MTYYDMEIEYQNALRVSEMYYKQYISGTIEQVFRKFESYSVRINHLTIDLGIVSPDEIPDKLAAALESELRKLIRNMSDNLFFTSGTGLPLDDLSLPIITESRSVKPSETIAGEESFDLFLNYLCCPAVPWFMDAVDFDVQNLTNQALAYCLSGKETGSKSKIRRLITLLTQNKDAFRRFIELVTIKQIEEISHAIDPAFTLPRHKRKQVYADFWAMYLYNESCLRFPHHSPGVSDNCIRDYLVEKADPASVSVSSDGMEGESAESSTLQQKSSSGIYETEQMENHKQRQSSQIKIYSQTQDAFLAQAGQFTVRITPSDTTESGQMPLLETISRQERPQNSQVEIHSQTQDAFLTETGQPIEHTLPSETAESGLSGQHLSRTLSRTDTSRHIRITNSGIVLLAPMLATLFNRLGYFNSKGVFRSLQKQIRAVHLLQHLTGGKGKQYEHLLPLNKILCGLHPDFPVGIMFRPGKKEKEEVAGLLQSVINYWPVMQGTSIGALQETFIRRNGIIESSEGDWIIRVENKTVDILLDELPWSITPLAFSWNNYLIHVEWKR
jgi:hypothetical protein